MKVVFFVSSYDTTFALKGTKEPTGCIIGKKGKKLFKFHSSGS
jgi:hypothetical protein